MINIGKVQSLTSKKWYDITYNQTTRKYGCTCMAKAFNKDTDCKHVKQLKSGDYPYGKMNITEQGVKILKGKEKPNYILVWDLNYEINFYGKEGFWVSNKASAELFSSKAAALEMYNALLLTKQISKRSSITIEKV
jgi:hypothetical protein